MSTTLLRGLPHMLRYDRIVDSMKIAGCTLELIEVSYPQLLGRASLSWGGLLKIRRA